MKIIYLLLLFLLSSCVLHAQGLDTLQIRQNIDSAHAYVYSDQDKALRFAHQALASSRDKYYYGELNGLQLLGDINYQTGSLDSAVMYFHQAAQLSQQHRDKRETGHNYTSLATIYTDAGKPDSALTFCRLAVQTFQELKDSSSLCDILLRYGNIYNNLGNHDEAVLQYMQSIRICEAIQWDEYIAYNHEAIGIIHDKQGNYAQAEEYFLLAQSEYKSLDDLYGQMSIANNLGILYKNMKDYERSLAAYERCLLFADSVQFTKGLLGIHTNLGILHVETGQFNEALHHATEGSLLATTFQDRESYADNLNSLAMAHAGLKNNPLALHYGEQALEIAKEVQSLEKQRDASLTLSCIHKASRDYAQSLDYYKSYTVIKDSLFNLDRTQKISEHEAIYETEKKSKEIIVLANNIEIARSRKKLLTVGLVLSLFAGGLIVYSQWIRRVRDKEIREKEKILEQQQRKTLQLENDKITRELDFKKQELVTKALQLARKNEFLQSLQTEVVKMKEHSEGHITDAANRISRRIRDDIGSETEWDQFLSIFREVHQSFIEQLLARYPDVSHGEMRLACLMKMNLSGKEVASLLNITQEGVKKARYRLRKKLSLDSETDLQQFLLNFPQ